ncbi:O-antigen ligase family protein [Microbacterium indicum]|uniref:O-antigen ligase family protein n=1 Tax=Microbacterium indicum TaxID=358100 RepID=UPI000491C84D|nr:O-antigen ligase family protein [Microbacterium indicum]
MRAYASVLAFCAFAYSFLFNLVGMAGALALLGAMTVATIVIWILWSRREPLPRRTWRQHPLTVYAYAGFAVLSLAWSQWIGTSLLTLAAEGVFVFHAFFLALRFSKRDLLVIAERALSAVVVLSLAVELWVALRGAPLLPNFQQAPDDPDPHYDWIRGNLLDGFLAGGRIQGIVGNANLLAVLCLLALVVIVTRLVRRDGGTIPRVLIGLIALWLLVRAGSANMYVNALALVVVAVLVLVARRLPSTRARAWFFSVLGALALGLAAVLLFARDWLFGLLGRSDDLTGRGEIWEKVLGRWAESPVVGNGYAAPWLPWDPHFDGWIVDHGLTVFHGHSMWIDTLMQLGVIGAALLAIMWGTAFVRAAASATRGATMVPLLVIVMLLIQGLTEAAPIQYWELMAIVVISVGQGVWRTSTKASTAEH